MYAKSAEPGVSFALWTDEAKSSIFGWEFGLEISYLKSFLAYWGVAAVMVAGFGVSLTTGWTEALTGISVCLSTSKPSGFSITFLIS